MPLRTMIAELSPKLVILVHSRHPPSDEEWTAHIAELRQLGALTEHRIIVYSLGGGPNVHQRRQLMNLFGRRRPPPTVLMTDDVIARGIATAMSWVHKGIAVFSTDARDQAIRHLGLTDDEANRVSKTIDRCLRELAA